MCFHCRHTPGCWLKGFSYNNHQIPLLGCKPQTWAFPRCTALRGAVLLAASHMLESNWISPLPGPAQCFRSPACPQISFPLCLRGLSPVSVSPTRFTYSCSRSFSGLSAPSPHGGRGFSPSRGPGSSPSPGCSSCCLGVSSTGPQSFVLAPHSPGATAPSPPWGWAEGAVLVAAPCLVKSPQTVPRALGAGC